MPKPSIHGQLSRRRHVERGGEPLFDLSSTEELISRGVLERGFSVAHGWLNSKGAALVRPLVGMAVGVGLAALYKEEPSLEEIVSVDRAAVTSAITGAIIGGASWLLSRARVAQVKDIQSALNIREDGYVGPVTAAAAQAVVHRLAENYEAAADIDLVVEDMIFEEKLAKAAEREEGGSGE